MNKIAIIGPGAVGSTIAIYLLAMHPDLRLLGRQHQTLAYYANNNIEHAHTLQVTPLTADQSQVDILIIAVKIPQLDTVLREMKHLIHEQTIIILAQNGHGQLTRFEYPHVFQGVIYISGQKSGSTITHYRDHKIILEDCPETRAFCDIVAGSSLEVELTNDIDYVIWYKLLVNLAINSVTALSRRPAEVLQVSGIKHLCKQLLVEGVAVAQAENVYFNDDIIDEIMTIYDGYPNQMGTSMYYDIVSDNALEIEGIQGFLFKKARLHQLVTPVLDTIYPLLLAQQKY
ncbi:oxidoreductase [Staphylococcus equorum]|uniref:2-dehydropantoate 2-reductase n=1 Tax=Staphylococcus equorum TaxID=246432 RepID=A0A9X4L7Y3_9STAP|nr:oxidoreductase [Staphylococcus equorum]MDG0841809.1 oxidoreductase [Staphylococcus equorum]MDG0858139.1 oxidoreductase [Staphylococcus equorum]